MRKWLSVILLVAIALVLIPTATASTVCSYPIRIEVLAQRDGHFVDLKFYAITRSMQVVKRYTRDIYLEMSRDDLSKVGLRYHDKKPMPYPYWYYMIVSVPKSGKLYLGMRRLYLPEGTYHFAVHTYLCQEKVSHFLLHVMSDTATVWQEK